jgi:hypothetical protein
VSFVCIATTTVDLALHRMQRRFPDLRHLDWFWRTRQSLKTLQVDIFFSTANIHDLSTNLGILLVKVYCVSKFEVRHLSAH